MAIFKPAEQSRFRPNTVSSTNIAIWLQIMHTAAAIKSQTLLLRSMGDHLGDLFKLFFPWILLKHYFPAILTLGSSATQPTGRLSDGHMAF